MIWSPTHHALYDLVFAVVFLHLEQVVAEVQDVEASLLPQQGDDHAAGPVQPITKTLPGEHKQHVFDLYVKSLSQNERVMDPSLTPR